MLLGRCLALAVLVWRSELQAQAQRAESQNLYGHTLAKCDRTQYFNDNPEQRDSKHPVTGYFRNNECTASRCSADSVRCVWTYLDLKILNH
jgi:hypothetical protein